MAVRKRAVRAEKKMRRLFLTALFALLAAAAAAIIFYVSREAEIPVIERKGVQSVTFASYDPQDIVSLTVKNQEDEYTITQQNGVAMMEGRADFVFSENMLTPLLANAALVFAEEKIMDMPGSGYDDRDFGLLERGIHVSVCYADGREIAFRIGDLIPQETPLYYMRVEGDDGLYAVGQDVQEIFMLPADSLHAVTNPALNAELLDQISFTGENPFTMEYTGSEWYLTAPFRYPLSTAKVNAFLKKLEEIRFAQYVAPEEKADLPALGLSPALRTMTVSVAPSILTGYDENGQAIASEHLDGYELSFHCGADKGDVLFYCLYRGDVVLATRFSASVLLSQTYDTLLQTAPFGIAVNELTRLEWQSKTQTRAWDITLHERVLPNNEFETDDSGNVLYDVRVWQDENEVDSDAFLLFYSRLVDVAMTQRLPSDYVLPAQSEGTITLHRERDARRIELYAYGELHYAVSVDGVALYYISRDAIDGLQLP
ncbi:MAG: DUF4340 domain-containing protein [Clostridia bacterium]|nr:DUF4340 domain-containing protein [Clostridia bacterium]